MLNLQLSTKFHLSELFTIVGPIFTVLSVEVELLIYAHDCHTLACNLEGISGVLRAAQSLVESLHTAEGYNLMVRFSNFFVYSCLPLA